MDSLATGLAGIIILSVPIILWLRRKAHARYDREVAAIKALAEERSRGLTELLSRLDAVEKQDAQRKLMVDEEEAINRVWLSTSILAKAVSEREVALEKYYAALESHLNATSVSLERYYSPDLETRGVQPAWEIYRYWLGEAEINPEWLKDVEFHESTQLFHFRPKSRRLRRSRGLLQGSAFQLS